MRPETALNSVVLPTYARVLPGMFASQQASCALLVIGLHESLFVHRRQIRGPARGFWQFERAGVSGVLTHTASRDYARAVIEMRRVPTHLTGVTSSVLTQLEHDDLLACAFARLLLYTDAAPLPELDDASGMFAYYLRNWRPGAWDRGSAEERAGLAAKFMRHHRAAVEAVT